MNAKKTECMVTGKDTSQQPLSETGLLIFLQRKPSKTGCKVHLSRSNIISYGRIDKEISIRIHEATAAFNQLNSIWKNKTIDVPVKVRIYVAAVLTILTFGFEVWNTTRTQIRGLETFHQYFLRRIL
jgi:hypothetical protein